MYRSSRPATEFFVKAGIGVLYIRHDDVIVVDELGEGLAEHRVSPVGPGHEVLLTSRLIVDQRHRNKLVLQVYRLAPDNRKLVPT